MSNKVKNMRSWLLLLFATMSLSLSAQTITVTGNVKDTTGEPIIGASIVEKGNTTNGTITDLDGNFSIKVDGKKTLVISYIGMKTQEIAIQGKKSIPLDREGDWPAPSWYKNLTKSCRAEASLPMRRPQIHLNFGQKKDWTRGAAAKPDKIRTVKQFLLHAAINAAKKHLLAATVYVPEERGMARNRREHRFRPCLP